MTQRAWLLGCVIACVAMVGCTADDEGGLSVEDLPAEYAGAICDAFLRCFGPATPKNLSRSDCLTENIAAIQDSDFRYIEDAINDGRVSYRSSQASRCVDALQDAQCADLSGGIPSACDGVFVGARGEGDLCGLDEECEAGLFCRMTAACPGTCTARGNIGDVCEDDDQCASGLACGSDGACTAPALEGDPCGGLGDGDCALGLLCLTAAQGGNDTCVTYTSVFTKNDGDACSFNGGLELCDEGLSCAATRVGTTVTFACEPAVAAGSTCKLAVPDQCPAGQYCDTGATAGALTGLCTALPTDGQPCGNREVCAPRNECTSGVCHAVNRVGGSCDNDTHCASDQCNEGVCVAPMQCNPDA